MYNSYEGPTTLGISERWERVLCYALGWITGLVMLIVEQRNPTVRRHAFQSTLVFGTLGIVGFIVGLLGGILGHIPLVGLAFGLVFGVLGGALWVVTVVLWLVLIIMAYLRPNFVLPFGRAYERLIR